MTIRGVMGGAFGRDFVVGAEVGAGGAAPPATPWYLEGGVSAANCLIAYQPKGAADYATSKVNLASPGTYNATDGSAMAFNTATGWTCANGKYLKTGLVPASGNSVFVRYAGFTLANNNCWFGEYSGNNSLLIQSGSTTSYNFYNGQVQYSKGVQAAAAVLAMAGNKAYQDGSDLGITIGAWAGTTALQMYISGYNNNPTVGGNVTTGYIYAFAYYNTTLTDPQVLAISTAMAAL